MLFSNGLIWHYWYTSCLPLNAFCCFKELSDQIIKTEDLQCPQRLLWTWNKPAFSYFAPWEYWEWFTRQSLFWNIVLIPVIPTPHSKHVLWGLNSSQAFPFTRLRFNIIVLYAICECCKSFLCVSCSVLSFLLWKLIIYVKRLLVKSEKKIKIPVFVTKWVLSH